MSVGRLFLINELKRLEMHFYPDSTGDEEAIEYIRAAIRALTAQGVSERAPTKPSGFSQLRKKATSSHPGFNELRRYSGSPNLLFHLEAVFQRFLTGMLND
jgi:hypothetical protein